MRYRPAEADSKANDVQWWWWWARGILDGSKREHNPDNTHLGILLDTPTGISGYKTYLSSSSLLLMLYFRVKTGSRTRESKGPSKEVRTERTLMAALYAPKRPTTPTLTGPALHLAAGSDRLATWEKSASLRSHMKSNTIENNVAVLPRCAVCLLATPSLFSLFSLSLFLCRASISLPKMLENWLRGLRQGRMPTCRRARIQSCSTYAAAQMRVQGRNLRKKPNWCASWVRSRRSLTHAVS